MHFCQQSVCHFRFTIVADSNLAMSTTIFILISIDTLIFYLKYTVQNLISNDERIV